MKTLTGARKMMNMVKLGTVSRAGNYFQLPVKRHKQRVCSLMCYILCEIKGDSKRNSSRNSSEFYIPPIIGCPLVTLPPVGESGSVCNTRTLSRGRDLLCNPHPDSLAAVLLSTFRAKLFHLKGCYLKNPFKISASIFTGNWQISPLGGSHA